MSYAQFLDRYAEFLEGQALGQDAKDEALRTKLGEAWDESLKARNINAPVGGGYYEDVRDVLSDACAADDDSIFVALMQALVHCAAKGQVEAVEALDKVKAVYVEKTAEHLNRR